MRVAVGSYNPAKIEAVRLAFNLVMAWLDKTWEILSYQVDSGVPDQPIGDAQCIKGARSRARKALLSSGLRADFAVGLEGGLCGVDDLWFDRGWVIVVDKNGKEGIGSTCSIIVPDKILSIIRGRRELGEAVDEVFGTINCKEEDGYFGLMTNNAITRTYGYRDGVIVALARFIRPEIF